MKSLVSAIALVGVAGIAQAQTPLPTKPITPPPAKEQSQPTESKPPVRPVSPDDGKLPAVAPAPIDPKSYIIGAEDILFIEVWRERDFSGPRVVRPDGKISISLVGDLQAAGLTPERLSAHVKEALQKYINTPDVTISVSQVNSKKYFIDGEVGRPGPVPMPVPITVLEALSNAGGFRDFANKKKIVILRGSKRLYFNYNEVIKGKKMEQNILLQSGDHILVN